MRWGGMAACSSLSVLPHNCCRSLLFGLPSPPFLFCSWRCLLVHFFSKELNLSSLRVTRVYRGDMLLEA